MVERFWILGAVIVALVLLQAAGITIDLLRRLAHQAAQRRRDAERIDLLLEAARRRGAEEERESVRWVGWRKFEVFQRVTDNRLGDICSFYLAPHDGKPIPAYSPGQFLTFQLQIPGQMKSTIRCYSLSDAPKPDRYRVTIKRVPAPPDSDAPAGLASNFFHDSVQVGDILDVKAPAGGFTLDLARPAPAVLVGGGVGVTPVLSMLNALAGRGDRREVWFFYGVRHGGEQIMKDHLASVGRDLPNLNVRICFSRPKEEDVVGRDYQHEGRIGIELFRKLLPSNNYDFYLCAPPAMLEALTADLLAWGVPKERIHFEKFGPGRPKPPPPKAASPGKGFAIVFTKSGKRATWVPGTGTLLDLARSCGVAIDSGCERGDCGTCQTAVRKGEVRYPEKPVFAFEDGTCLACCAEPAGPMELDA